MGSVDTEESELQKHIQSVNLNTEVLDSLVVEHLKGEVHKSATKALSCVACLLCTQTPGCALSFAPCPRALSGLPGRFLVCLGSKMKAGAKVSTLRALKPPLCYK